MASEIIVFSDMRFAAELLFEIFDVFNESVP